MTKIIVAITSGIFYYLPKYDISLMFDSIFGGYDHRYDVLKVLGTVFNYTAKDVYLNSLGNIVKI